MQIQGGGEEVARGPIAFRGGSLPEFLRKPIATCDFPEGFGPLVPPTGSANDNGQSTLL